MSLSLVEDVRVDDYVVDVGYALAKIDEEEAKETLALLRRSADVGAET